MSKPGRDQIIELTKELCAARSEIQCAILYGSVLTDQFADHSDVDLAIAGARQFTYDELFSVSDAIGSAVGREVQVRDLRRLEGLILREVLLEGSVIKNDEPDFLGRRISDMLDFTEDLLPAVRAIQAAAIQRVVNDK